MLHAATESLGRIIQLTKRKRWWLHWRGDDKMDMSYILRLKRLWLCTVKVKHSLRKKKMAELTLKINIRRLVGEKQNNLLRHSNHICQWNQVKSQKRLDLVKDLGRLWKCNLVVKYNQSHLHSQVSEWSLTDNTELFTAYASVCWMRNRKRKEREGAFHSHANLNISLSSPCQSASGSKHLLDRWRHSHAEAGARVTLNPQCKRDLGCMCVCVCVSKRESDSECVCVCFQAWSQTQRALTPHMLNQKLRCRDGGVCGVMVRGRD